MNNLLTDFYELTMGQAYFKSKVSNNIAVFDIFFRKCPDGGSFAIANGMADILDYLKNWTLTKEDIDYLKSLNQFTPDFLDEIENIKFTGDMWAVEDGTVVFPNEPVVTIKAPLLEAQLVETALLNMFNHSSLITTKASRIVRAAKGRPVMEFGTRRAQGENAAVQGAREAIIAGCKGTACTVAGKNYGIKVLGTMAHSFVQYFDTEYEAFKQYALAFPDDCSLLVDTYNTLKSGIPNAIRVHNEVLKPMGKSLKGIRIDSGDLAYLSKQAKAMLYNAGIKDAKIIISNALDEKVIESLLDQGAPIDSFGVGENLITAKSDPVFGGVYKLVAIEKEHKLIPKIKISDNPEKTTNPAFKKIFRFYDENGMFITDEIALFNETTPMGKHEFVHPEMPFRKKEITNFTVKDLKVKMIENGKQIYTVPTIANTAKHVQDELKTLWEEAQRLENPHKYYISLSKKLTALKNEMLFGNKEKDNQTNHHDSFQTNLTKER